MSSSSSVQQGRAALGLRLREIRREAGLTARDLGERMGRHGSKISRIEHGKAVPSPADIHTWCEHCEASELVPELLASLHAIESLFIEWQRMERAGLRQAQESVAPLWERTRWCRIYSSFVIPGPLQTLGYITAVLSELRDRRELFDDVGAAAQVRVDRQRVLQAGDRRFAVVLEESLLRHAIGGAATMARQLGHLLTIGALPSISLGIIPMNVDRSTAWPVESFWMFDQDQVAVELVSGYLTITQPREIAMYEAVFTRFAALAVHGAAARALITQALAALDRPER